MARTGSGASPAAQLLRGIMDVFAQYERAIIPSRTKAWLAAKKAKGLRAGTIPHGYRLAVDARHVEKDADEQAVIARARELRADGLGLRAIGHRLLEEGRTPRSAKNCHVQVVRRVLARRAG